MSTLTAEREKHIQYELHTKDKKQVGSSFLCFASFLPPACTPSFTFPRGHSADRTLGCQWQPLGHSWGEYAAAGGRCCWPVAAKPSTPAPGSSIPVLAAQSCLQILQAPLGYQNLQWRIPRAPNTFSSKCPVIPGINLFTSLFFKINATLIVEY